MQLTDFSVLSFDCYGTLIDWESGLSTALDPLLARARHPIDRDAALAAFAEEETLLEVAEPSMRYADLLAMVYHRLAARWGVAADPGQDRRFAASVGNWPAFPDTVEALRDLQTRYKLVILSNIDRASFAATLPRLGVVFDAVFTAEDIGSYKPDPSNFAYLVEHLAARGIARHQILHTAQSLFHDHAPAQAAGVATAWIDRRRGAVVGGATAPPPAGVRWDFRFETLAEMAAAAGLARRTG